MSEKPTPAQKRALAVLGRSAIGANDMEVALALWGVPSAANEGKARSLLRRLVERGWAFQSARSQWFVTDKGRSLVTLPEKT